MMFPIRGCNLNRAMFGLFNQPSMDIAIKRTSIRDPVSRHSVALRPKFRARNFQPAHFFQRSFVTGPEFRRDSHV